MGINFFPCLQKPMEKNSYTWPKKKRKMERNRKADKSSRATNLNWVQMMLPRDFKYNLKYNLSEFVETKLPILSTELKEIMLIINSTH